MSKLILAALALLVIPDLIGNLKAFDCAKPQPQHTSYHLQPTPKKFIAFGSWVENDASIR
ncbi:MAG: hypothetical protein IJ905_16605 [Fibrobacter sp.]|nr:hypothetical protein [Fibrobacter sp.]